MSSTTDKCMTSHILRNARRNRKRIGSERTDTEEINKGCYIEAGVSQQV